MRAADIGAELGERVRAAAATRAPLRLRGSGSKDFLGNASSGDVVDVGGHAGIVHYAPDELVLTARAGTRLADIDALLDGHGQMLAFEPPHFGPDATLGGTLAAGLSGPRRASVGSARDFVLGARIVDGRGQTLRFGGEVIKNVAGYDVSRLMVGAFGTLGLILDASVRLMPKPRREATRVLELDAAAAHEHVLAWARRALPLSASAIFDGRLYVRFSGAAAAVDAAVDAIGGESDDGDALWSSLREQNHAWFDDARPLWRLSVSPAAPLQDLAGPQLVEWQGAQRWLRSDVAPATVRAAAESAGGHATRFRAGTGATPSDSAFHPLPPALLALQRRVRDTFDPHRIFNRGRFLEEA